MPTEKSLKNLIPLSERSDEEKKVICSQAGIASQIKRRERKTMREELLILLEQGDTQAKVSLALIHEALNGSTKAFEVIRDTIGEKPVDKVENKVAFDNGKLDDILKAMN
jgi:hypothetical protein